MRRIILPAFALATCLFVFTSSFAQTDSSWFGDMLQTALSTATATWRKAARAATWGNLRNCYKNHESLLEMSWEERDRIWQQGIAPNN